MENFRSSGFPAAPLNGRASDAFRLASPRRRFPLAALAGIVGLAVVGGIAAWYFLGRGKAVESSGPGAAPAPVAVGVQTVLAQKQRIWNAYSGRLKAVDAADIRPEVSGRITEVRFTDGQEAKAGDVLLVIDPRPYEAAAARAEARIVTAQATLTFTAADQIRQAKLLEGNAVAQREVDQADSAHDAAMAELKAAEAQLKTANVDVDHAYVKAPISGRVGRAELTVGNLVQSGPGAPLLTSIVAEDDIYADFEVDEQTYLDAIRGAASGNAQEKTVPVDLVVEGNAGRVHHGFIQNFDNKLDSASGTIRARARFENPDHTLVPGMFVSVRLAGSRERDLLVVSDRALAFDQSKTTVLVVGPENKISYREIVLGAGLVGSHVVVQGLQAGDKVVVDGVQRVRPGSPVVPTEIDPAAQDAPPPPSTFKVNDD